MITVIGTGTASAGNAPDLSSATLVVGARRHLEAVRLPNGATRIVLGPLGPALDAIAEHLGGGRPPSTGRTTGLAGRLDQPPGARGAGAAPATRSALPRGERARTAGSVVVLASGDPGFFGIVRALADRFGPDKLFVRPSVPSVAVAFARIGLPWDDAVVVSAHGRDPRAAVNVCRAHPKTAVLTGPGAGPGELGAALVAAGVERTLVVGTGLGTPEETVERLSPGEAADRYWGGGAVSVVLSLDERRALASVPATTAGAPPLPAGWALPEEEFAHRDSMVTKYEVRALALARLGPRLGDLVWDIGAGSGSVAVECARLGAAAVAVEKTADGAERVRANAAAHGVDVQSVHGTAPEVLERLPEPDAVFIGGGGDDLPDIVAACARRAHRSVVVTLAAVDRVPPVRAALAAAGLVPDGVLLQSSRLAPLPGEVTRLAANNPVFVLWGTRSGSPGGPRDGSAGGTRGSSAGTVREATEPARAGSPSEVHPTTPDDGPLNGLAEARFTGSRVTARPGEPPPPSSPAPLSLPSTPRIEGAPS